VQSGEDQLGFGLHAGRMQHLHVGLAGVLDGRGQQSAFPQTSVPDDNKCPARGAGCRHDPRDPATLEAGAEVVHRLAERRAAVVYVVAGSASVDREDVAEGVGRSTRADHSRVAVEHARRHRTASRKRMSALVTTTSGVEIASDEFRGLLLRFRGRSRLSQAQLAARARVHLRSVQTWESGDSLPSTDRLQALIVALLDTGGFTPDAAESEARALWSAVEHASSRQHPPFDARWFADARGGRATSTTPLEVVVAQDWADAPDTSGFLGRRAELESLREVVVQQRAGLVILGGMAGIGKTTLAIQLAREVAPCFDALHWRSLRNSPSFHDWSTAAIGFLTNH
jgi:DNA-binding transcriptional regulator YiaG